MPLDAADPRVISGYLDEVAGELDAFGRLLVPPVNRLAPYHLQQAAEKLIKAVRLARGLQATVQHNLEILVDELEPRDPWKSRLATLEWLSVYATAYRYPSATSGFRKPPPDDAKLRECARAIEAMLVEARSTLLPS